MANSLASIARATFPALAIRRSYYFRPGDTGFKVWDTAFGRIGVGICWDQWFPEAARCDGDQGAQVLFYPTAIGSEPHDSSLDTRDPWRRAMQGHAVSNVIPVVASNRIGTEASGQKFYGSKLHCRSSRRSGRKPERTERVLAYEFDLDYSIVTAPRGLFRDRRMEFYR